MLIAIYRCSIIYDSKFFSKIIIIIIIITIITIIIIINDKLYFTDPFYMVPFQKFFDMNNMKTTQYTEMIFEN